MAVGAFGGPILLTSLLRKPQPWKARGVLTISMARFHATADPRRGVLVIALAVLLASLLVPLFADRASGRSAKTLGATKRTPSPSCPRNPCEAVGSVTGLQLKADGKRGLFKARESGMLVSWAIKLSRPKAEQRTFFGDFYENSEFGSRPTARIAVLRRDEKRKYTLRRQGPVVDLGSAYNTRQVFTLSDPLRINRGEFLALTIPTWAPAFAVGLNRKGNRWRASRGKKKCQGAGNIRAGNPHQKVGSTRNYGCDYKTARLLYWGHYVPK